MNKKILLLLLILMMIFANTLVAQTGNDNLPKQVSTGKAMLYSALLPGAGEMYLQNYTRGAVFLGAEILIIASYFRLSKEIDWKVNSYMKYAENYADVPFDSGDNYYRLINNYISSDEYNKEIEQYLRNRYIVYEYRPDLYEFYSNEWMISDDESWEWDSRENWLEYRSLRRDRQQLDILANFAIGAAVINRVISVIDSALMGRNINRERSLLSNINLEPDFRRKGYMLSYEFKF